MKKLPWSRTDYCCRFSLADRFLKTGRELALFYLWGHSYEFDGDQNWDVLERFLEKTAGRPDTWYASNGEICAYLTAARRLLTGEGFLLNPTDTDLWVRAGGEALRVPAGEWAASFEILAPGTTLPMHATALSDWAAADRAAITEKVMIAIFFIHFIYIT